MTCRLALVLFAGPFGVGLSGVGGRKSSITVPFHGADLYVVEHNGQPYTPMKPIAEGMGLAWSPQRRKMADRFKSTMIELITVAEDGKQRSMTCLPLRKLPGWLNTVSPGKIKNPEVRARVIQYQNECDDALWAYWNEGIAINPRAAYSVNPGDVLTKDEADTLRNLIMSTAHKLSSDMQIQGKFIMQAWSKLKAHFKVGYREIPRHELPEAISIVTRHTVAWDVVEDPKPAVDVTSAEALMASRQIALDYMDDFRSAVRQGAKAPRMKDLPAEVVQGVLAGALMSQRMLVSFDHEGRMCSTVVPEDCSIISLSSDRFDRIAEQIPVQRLPELAAAINQRMADCIVAMRPKWGVAA